MTNILRALKDFRFIRKHLGGTWYNIRIEEGSSGIADAIEYWTDNENWREVSDTMLLQKEEYPIRRDELLKVLSGDNVYCPVCENSILTFLPFGRIKRANAQCPVCDSLERHRLQFLYLKNDTNFFDGSRKKMLHVAPESIFFKKFSNAAGIEYYPIDKFTDGYAYMTGTKNMDLLSLAFKDNTFDVIICNHVLEHIPDDRKAMREIYRVLKPGGFAILQVPVDKDLEITYEDNAITDPTERIKHFGQFDHVRNYGRDYGNRLSEAGFRVHVIDYIRQLGDNSIFRYGLMAGEDIYRCEK